MICFLFCLWCCLVTLASAFTLLYLAYSTFYFEKENQLQYILKVFFEEPMSVFFAVCFFSERGPGSSGLSKTCFGVIAENLFFAKLFARPRQRCHAGQYCGGRTSWRGDRSNEWLCHWKRKWFQDLGVDGNATHSIYGTGILTFVILRLS